MKDLEQIAAEAVIDAGEWKLKCRELERELAALKAQKSGVVLPEIIREAAIKAADEVFGEADCEWTKEDDLFYPAFLREVARLNSSLASAGDREALICLMERFDNEVWVCPRCSHEEPTNDMDSASYLREYLAGAQPVSAVDNRADFEAFAKRRGLSTVKYPGGMYVSNNTMWSEIAWVEARAALSAKHSEQLREQPNQLAAVKVSLRMLESGRGVAKLEAWDLSQLKPGMNSLYAATPSAGSQKGKGE